MTRPRIKKLTTYREFENCVAIQRRVWKHSAHDLTPAHQFCIAIETGSILLGGYIGPSLAGFVYSFPALFQGRLCQHSHLLAVLPRYQGSGLGKTLKWAQRDEAVKLGYGLMTWTYDPLQVRNATLNLHTLGATSRTYLPNFYGRIPSLLFSPDADSDRLKMEWVLRSDRVARRRAKVFPPYDPACEVKALEGRMKNGRLDPGPVRKDLDAGRLLIEIPRDLKKYRRQPGYIQAWQGALHRALGRYFERGWRLADFIQTDRCFYVLEKKVAGLKDNK